MAHDTYWPKAFGISCAVHIVIFLLLGALVGNLSARHLAEEYIVIDLTAVSHIGGGGGGGNAGATPTLQPAGEPPRQAAPVPVRPAVPPPSPAEISRSNPDEGIVTAVAEASALCTDDAAGKPAAGTTGNAAAGSGSGSGGGTGSGSGSGGGGGSGSGSGGGDGSGIGPGSGPGINGAIAAFLAEVEKHKEYPYIARRRGQEGVVTVFVELSTGGELRQVNIERSSGFSQLDEAAVSVIRRVSPFYHGLGRPVAMKIPISYQLLP